MLMDQLKGGYVPASVQRAMDQHMQNMPANLQKYQSGNTYIPTQARQQMADYMQKTMPGHMQQYIGSYMEQKTVSGLNSLDPVRPVVVKDRAPTPNLMRRDHSAPGEQFSVNIDPKANANKSFAYTPQYHAPGSAAPEAPTPSPTSPQYDFIMNPGGRTPKKSLFGFGGSSKQRILFMSIATGLILALVLILYSVLFGGAKTPGLLEIAQTQQEIIRVSELGAKQARTSDALALAATTKSSLVTSQNEIVAQLKKQKQKVKPKDLALKQNSETDKVLTEAALNNRYDETFTKTLQQELVEYQQLLKTTYDSTSSQSLQKVLNAQFTSAGLLIASTQPTR